MERLLKEERYHLPFLFVFSLLLYIPFLGGRDLWAPVEPRYGEIARLMFSKGDWVVPSINGELYTDKPILYFWLVLAVSHLKGAVDEWAVRLPSALSSVGLVAVTYLMGRDFFNRRVGLLGALILATATRTVWEARWAHTDMLFTFFFTCSLYLLLRLWLARGGRREALLAYLFMGLATLTKGFIGVVLPGLILGILFIHERDIKKLRPLHLPLGALIFVLTIALWFVPVTLKTEGRWMSEFIWTHHVQRYLSGLGHREPFYYYFVNFAPDFLPWTLSLIPAVIAYWPERKTVTQPVPLALAGWFLAVFIFFSLSDTKRGLYLLPLYPPVALFVAGYWLRLHEGHRGGARTLAVLHYIFFAVLLASAIVAPVVALKARPEFAAASIPLALAGGVGSLMVLVLLRKRRFLSCYVWIAMISLAGFLCLAAWIFPKVDLYKSARPFAVEVRRAVAPTDPLYIYSDTMNDFNFYLEREIVPVLFGAEGMARLRTEKKPVYLLIRERDMGRALQGSGLQWNPAVRREIGGKTWLLLEISGREGKTPQAFSGL